MSTLISFSENESQFLDIKVGRCNTNSLDELELRDLLLKENYDMCRLKVPSENEFTPFQLENIGFPFYFSGSIRRYKTLIDENHKTPLLHPKLEFEKYDGSQQKLLFEMLKGTWGDYPLGYYRTPYLNDFIDKEIEIKCVYEYYKNDKNPNNSIMFMKEKNQYIGFFALNRVKENLESHIGGILKEHLKGKYFHDILAFIKNYCLDQKIPYFSFGARNENARVQAIYQASNFLAIGTENVFHIVSFLNKSKLPKIEKTLKLRANKKTDIYSHLYSEICTSLKDKFNQTIVSHRINLVSKIDKEGAYRLSIGFPVTNKNYMFVVMKLIDKVNNTVAFGHFKCVDA